MSSPRLEIAIDSRLEELDLVDEVTEAWLGWLQFAEDRREQMVLAIREAVANAVVHGNQRDPGKRVEIELLWRNSEAVVSVKDEGGGFDPKSLPDPRLPENLLRHTGRGILLMKAFMDHVEFDFDGGTKVTMRSALARETEGNANDGGPKDENQDS